MSEHDKHSLFSIGFLMFVLIVISHHFMWWRAYFSWHVILVCLIVWMVRRLFVIRPWEYQEEERRQPVVPSEQPRKYVPNAAHYIS